MTIALLDVHYNGAGARAACVLAQSWQSESPDSTYVKDIAKVEPYEPGQFFRRELPCLLSVLRVLPSSPAVLVVVGYVWLSPAYRPGLGAYLYEALGRATPVVGIAKTRFAGVACCESLVRVFRGASRKPLFVTAAGLEARAAGQCVRQMAGSHRIPELMRIADQLSRGKVAANLPFATVASAAGG